MQKVKPLADLIACPECSCKLKGLKCPKCGAAFLQRDGIFKMYDFDSVPDDLKVSIKSWNKIYKAMNTKEVEEYCDFYTETLFPEIRDHMSRYNAIKESGVFLEIGSGLSILGIEMAKLGYQVVCIDICEEVLKKAKKLYDDRGLEALFICGNILKMPLIDNSIDLSFGRGVIEHFRDTGKAISELNRVATPLGIAINTVPPISLSTLLYRLPEGNIPNLPIIRELLEWIFMVLLKGRRSVHGYELSFNASQMRRFFSANGFDKIEVGWTGFYVPIDRLKSKSIKRFARKLFRYRPFWHSMYINATKPGSNNNG